LVTTCKENGQVRKKSTRERKTLLKNGLILNSSCLCASFNSDSQSTNSGADLQREDSQ
jgi:hypothetical protein